MAQTKIRSSKQLAVDANFDFGTHKGVSLVAGTTAGDAVEYNQLNTAIGNALSGMGAIHAPVADLAAAKAVPATDAVTDGVITNAGREDKMIMLVESLGLYRFDLESTATGDDNLIITPTAGSGRWLKISSTLTDHNLLSNLNVGDYLHLTATEYAALVTNFSTSVLGVAPAETALTIGALINAANLLTIADADLFALADVSVSGTPLTKYTYQSLYQGIFAKVTGGDFTIASTGVGTIAAKAVTLAKMNDMATASFIGRNTAGTGIPEVLSVSTAKSMLGITNANRVYRAVATYISSGLFRISGIVILADTEEVFLNGQLMNLGADNDYTITRVTNTDIQFVGSLLPTGSDVVLVNYSI